MSGPWPWWLGGVALAAVAVIHWFALGRQLAVSGRFTALVNRLRSGAEPEEAAPNPADLLAALREATRAEFGAASLVGDAEASHEPAASSAQQALPARRKARSTSEHAVFLLSLTAGGALSVALQGSAVAAAEPDRLFAMLFGSSSWLGPAVLGLGGCLVGFGTRMAAGCTSGHGLCGVSRFQRGSLLATVMFFGAGAVTALLLGNLT